MKQENRGGHRQGAGRKAADPQDKRVQMVITIDRHTRDILHEASKGCGVKPGRIIDNLVKDLENQ